MAATEGMEDTVETTAETAAVMAAAEMGVVDDKTLSG